MNVKELKELIKDAPDDMEVVLGDCDDYYVDNIFFKLRNINEDKLFLNKTKEYYKESSSQPNKTPEKCFSSL
jgi:hypothetical protein